MANSKNRVSQKLMKHYQEQFKLYGCASEGVDWGANSVAVDIRHRVMLNLVANSPATLLDVGCGYGAFWETYRDENLCYTGIDIVPEMIKSAAQRHPDAQFICDDFLDMDIKPNSYDYVFSNGILTQKLRASNSEMNEFAKLLIKKMFDVAKVGIAFNIMKSKVNYTSDNLFYKCPLELLGWVMEEVSPYFTIDHSYPLYEYTVYIYKKVELAQK